MMIDFPVEVGIGTGFALDNRFFLSEISLFLKNSMKSNLGKLKKHYNYSFLL